MADSKWIALKHWRLEEEQYNFKFNNFAMTWKDLLFHIYVFAYKTLKKSKQKKTTIKSTEWKGVKKSW